MTVLRRDAYAVAIFIFVLLYWKRSFSMRGITYRSSVVPLWQDRLTKSLFYTAFLSILDMVLRSAGKAMSQIGLPVLPSCARQAAYARALLIYIPFAIWAIRGPLSETGGTRDDRGFSHRATQSRFWKWIATNVFGGHVRILLSEEWAGLRPDEVEKWRDEHFVIGMHPHGLLPFGAILAGLTWAGGGLQGVTPSGKQLPTEENPGPYLHQAFFRNMKLRAAVASGACGLFPGFYEMFSNLGAFECTKPFMQKVLREGKDIAVFPGGAQESAYAAPGRYVCFIKQHKGFVRLALEERKPIMPMWTFGDEATLPQWQNPPPIVNAVQRFFKEATGLLVPPAFAGLPNAPPLTLITGVPIDLSDLYAAEVGGAVSEAAVEEGHRRYVEAQIKLFDANKALVPGGHEKARIEIL